MIIERQHVSLIKPSQGNGGFCLTAIEFAGRNCYASQSKIKEGSSLPFVKNLIERGHEAPLEFADLTFDITTSRAVMAELTRHRLVSFCIESQRYIQEAASGDISFIAPEWYEEESGDSIVQIACATWRRVMSHAEDAYKALTSVGMTPQEAREVLPNSTACRIIAKANVREWRHVFELRCAKSAYPQMRTLATEMLVLAHDAIPVAFDDLYDRFANSERSAE